MDEAYRKKLYLRNCVIKSVYYACLGGGQSYNEAVEVIRGKTWDDFPLMRQHIEAIIQNDEHKYTIYDRNVEIYRAYRYSLLTPSTFATMRKKNNEWGLTRGRLYQIIMEYNWELMTI